MLNSKQRQQSHQSIHKLKLTCSIVLVFYENLSEFGNYVKFDNELGYNVMSYFYVWSILGVVVYHCAPECHNISLERGVLILLIPVLPTKLPFDVSL